LTGLAEPASFDSSGDRLSLPLPLGNILEANAAGYAFGRPTEQHAQALLAKVARGRFPFFLSSNGLPPLEGIAPNAFGRLACAVTGGVRRRQADCSLPA
jgi:hypothetical protein